MAIDDSMSFEQRLFEFTLNSGQKEPHFLIFRSLQRLNILELQNSIARCKQATWEHRQFTEERPGITSTSRDWASPSSAVPADPLRDLLKRHLPCSVTYTGGEMKRRTDEYLARQPAEEVSPAVDRLARFAVAFLRGSPLVLPMLIMRLPEVALAKSLITASVSVLLFAVALSILFRASNTDTMAATATYAAVLVVFVGTSS